MLELGTRVGPYVVLDQLGAGGMGVVYTAIEEASGRRVALKVLSSHQASNEARVRFQREVTAARRLRHPNVCEILGAGETAQQAPWFAMPLYAGQTLDHRLRAETFSVERALKIGEQLARALEYSHDAGIVHRDVKPSNLMIDENDHLTLLDFGLAKVQSDDALTRTGTSVGTMAYMSPEQALGGSVDARTDIWAFGVVLYELLVGEGPFQPASGPALLFAIVHREPPSLTDRVKDLPEAMAELTGRCLAKEPALRPPTAGAVRDILARVQHERSSAHDDEGFATRRHRTTAGERRPLTALCVIADGVPPATLSERLRAIVAPYEGSVTPGTEGCIAVFGARVVHEDDALRAVRCAMALHHGALSGGSSPLRIGIASRPVATDRAMADAAVTLARLAAPGESTLDRETDRLLAVRSAIETLGVRAVPMRPVETAAAPSGALRLEAVADQPDAAPRVPLVGRQEELGILQGAIDRLDDGQPSVIGISAAAGAGKTRLIEELRAMCGARVRWIEGRAVAYARHIPYYPLLDLFSRQWGIGDMDAPDEVRRKLETGFDALGPLAAEVRPVIARLFEVVLAGVEVIDREAFGVRLLAAVQRTLRHWADAGPVVICIQDLHWADRGTTQLIRSLAAGLDAPVLLLTNFRTDYSPPPDMRVLELAPLSGRQVRTLLRTLLAGEPDSALAEYVEQRADGTPFFVEELVASLRDEARLVLRDGHWTVDGDLRDLSLPTGVRGMLAARIDRLPDHARSALRRAAVIGREFSVDVLATLVDAPETVRDSLLELERADLIQPHDVARDAFRFKHALVQDAAYDGLEENDRASLHGRVGLSLERAFGRRAAENAETLAWHFVRAAMAEQAVDYLIIAGRRAVERYALPEATRAFRAAHELVGSTTRPLTDPVRLARLLCEWSVVHYYEGTAGEWVRLLEQHRAEVEVIADVALRALYLGWLGNALLFFAGPSASAAILEPAYALAEQSGDGRTIAYVRAWLSTACLWRGRIGQGLPIAAACFVDDATREIDAYPWFKSGSAQASMLAVSGDYAAARTVSDAMLAYGLRHGSTRAAAMGHFGRSIVAMLSLDFDAAVASGIEAETASRFDPAFRPQGAIGQCFGLSASSRFAELRAPAERYLAEMREKESQLYVTPLRGFLAAAGVVDGRLDASIKVQYDVYDELAAMGSDFSQMLSLLFTANAYVVTARREVAVPVSVLLRNLWFVRHVVFPARRHALERLTLARRTIATCGADGMLPWADFIEARLVARSDRARARALLERSRAALRAGGADPDPAPVRQLVTELG